MSKMISKTKVKLSEDQLEDICSSIPINQCLPEYVSKSISNRIRTKLYNDLCNISIYPEMYQKFKEEIVKHYYKSLAEGGLAVGIYASTSLGERQTQTTLNSFHAAGLSVKTVVVGVPRFSELLNATKSPKMVNCLIYLNEEFEDISHIRNRIGNSFTDMTFKRLIKSYELVKDDPLEDWHYLFCELYDIKPSNLGWRLRFFIDLSMLYEYQITLKMIANAIMNEYADATVIYTPDWKGIIDVFVDESCFTEIEQLKNIFDKKNDNLIDEEEEDKEDKENDNEEDEDDEEDEEKKEKKDIKDIKISINFEGKEDEVPEDVVRVIHMEDKILPNLQTIRISGIEKIKDIFFEKRKDEWIISTEGSNLYGLFSNPLVDKNRTMCNDMWEIYNVFGIEAARQFLIEEYMDVVTSDGSFVNSSHVELLVDIMTYTGTIISISRYGQKKVGCGPMAKASFEESLENFLKAGLNGEKENTDGISASIMLGKMPKTGTGVFDMYLDIPKIINYTFDKEDKKKVTFVDTKEIKEIKEISKEMIKKEENKEKQKVSTISSISNSQNIFKKNLFFDD
jgi:DNA-directed RNA polymerase II subunit RPB1